MARRRPGRSHNEEDETLSHIAKEVIYYTIIVQVYLFNPFVPSIPHVSHQLKSKLFLSCKVLWSK